MFGHGALPYPRLLSFEVSLARLKFEPNQPMFLQVNRRFLIGQSVDAETTEGIKAILMSRGSIEQLHQVGWGKTGRVQTQNPRFPVLGSTHALKTSFRESAIKV